MTPGEPMLKDISIKVDGMVNDFNALTWFVLGIPGKFWMARDEEVKTYPVKSADVLTTLPDIPAAEEVEVATKLLHFTV